MKALALCVALLLSGCSVLFVPHWDATEYNGYVRIATEASYGTCTPEKTQKLSILSTHASLYSEFLPDNDIVFKAALLMDKTVQELNMQPHDVPIGHVYCSLKLRTIYEMATTLAKAVGGKPR